MAVKLAEKISGEQTDYKSVIKRMIKFKKGAY
jgi:hypothetical protein